MRRSSQILTSLAALSAIVAAAPVARAQVDVNPPLPNVMLLVDSSGSMEYKSSDATFPACDPNGNTPSEKSRWLELVEVLTGSIQDYRCETVDRNSTAFKNEYSLAGTLPPDANYSNPYHRPLSGTCTPGPAFCRPTPTTSQRTPSSTICFPAPRRRAPRSRRHPTAYWIPLRTACASA